MSVSFIFATLFALLIAQTACRSFLLPTIFPTLTSNGGTIGGIAAATAPESHISDFRNQPRANSQADRDAAASSTVRSPSPSPPPPTSPNGNFPAEIIGNLFEAVRARLVDAIGDLLAAPRTRERLQLAEPTTKGKSIEGEGGKLTGTNRTMDEATEGEAQTLLEALEAEDEEQELLFINETTEELPIVVHAQRPRLFPLIIRSLANFDDQTKTGYLQNATEREKLRLRALYAVRPLLAAWRRKAYRRAHPEVAAQIRETRRKRAQRAFTSAFQRYAARGTDGDGSSAEAEDDDLVESNIVGGEQGEFVGIMILEYIGTIVGLTWGALSQASHFLMGGNRN